MDSMYNHFFVKLLKVPDTMKTDLGKRVALKRLDIMERTVKLAKEEYEMADFD